MDKMYIHSGASISAQGFFPTLEIQREWNSPENFDANQPSYKEVLPGNLARRMAKITKMAVMCGLTISERSQQVWDGIIVATGMGNLADTEKFLSTYNHSNGGLIPPTSFTQSSHNTLAGQIALLLKNHGYNMTHVQREFSFENTLIDAQIQLTCGMKHVLVGGADEQIPFLKTAAEQLQLPDELSQQFGEGASFFHLSKVKAEVAVEQVKILRNVNDQKEAIAEFCATYAINFNTVYSVGCTALGTLDVATKSDATALCGRYFTNTAFAMHMASNHLLSAEKGSRALVINASHLDEIGLILLSRE